MKSTGQAHKNLYISSLCSFCILFGLASCGFEMGELSREAEINRTPTKNSDPGQTQSDEVEIPSRENSDTMHRKTTGLENPIECCMCKEECPPVNCPCVERAIVNLISVHIKKFRPRGIDNEPGSPWVKLDIVPGQYDLMELKEDLFYKIGTQNIPVGHYSMIRMTMIGEEIVFCGDQSAYPFYIAQENKTKIEIKKGIKLFETFYVCPNKHTKVTLKFPEDGLLTWIQHNATVRLHPKIWVEDVENL